MLIPLNQWWFSNQGIEGSWTRFYPSSQGCRHAAYYWTCHRLSTLVACTPEEIQNDIDYCSDIINNKGKKIILVLVINNDNSLPKIFTFNIAISKSLISSRKCGLKNSKTVAICLLLVLVFSCVLLEPQLVTTSLIFEGSLNWAATVGPAVGLWITMHWKKKRILKHQTFFHNKVFNIKINL